MRYFVLIFGASFIFFAAFVTQAASDDVPYHCGDIEKSAVDDTFDLAYALRLMFKRLPDDLAEACSVMQALQDWRDQLPRGRKNDRDIREISKKQVRDVQRRMGALEQPLRAFDVWAEADVRSKVDRAHRTRGLYESHSRIRVQHLKLLQAVHETRLVIKYDGVVPSPLPDEDVMRMPDLD